jgi:hypothetical protein
MEDTVKIVLCCMVCECEMESVVAELGLVVRGGTSCGQVDVLSHEK